MMELSKKELSKGKRIKDKLAGYHQEIVLLVLSCLILASFNQYLITDDYAVTYPWQESTRPVFYVTAGKSVETDFVAQTGQLYGIGIKYEIIMILV